MSYFSEISVIDGTSCRDQCDAIQTEINAYDCFKFYVEPFSMPKTFGVLLPNVTTRYILHIDEVDMVGLCASQQHCSVQKPMYTNFEANCRTEVNCGKLVMFARKMFNVTKLRMGSQRACWIDANRDENQGAIAMRQMENFIGSRAFHSVIWPMSSFLFSVCSCCTFWYKNRNHVLKFTQSG